MCRSFHCQADQAHARQDGIMQRQVRCSRAVDASAGRSKGLSLSGVFPPLRTLGNRDKLLLHFSRQGRHSDWCASGDIRSLAYRIRNP
jgi:hypothetical protein